MDTKTILVEVREALRSKKDRSAIIDLLIDKYDMALNTAESLLDIEEMLLSTEKLDRQSLQAKSL